MPALLLLTWIFDRMREPSTHAGAGAIAAGLGAFLPPQWAPVANAAAALLGALAVAMREKGGA